MAEISFHITDERKRKINMRAKIALQMARRHQEPDLRGLRDLLALFMTDEQGAYYPMAEARELLEEMSDEEQERIADLFLAALQDHNLPKSRSKPSSPPSTTAEQDPGGSVMSSSESSGAVNPGT